LLAQNAASSAERTFLSAAFDVDSQRLKSKPTPKGKIKAGGQECPAHTGLLNPEPLRFID